MFANRNRYSIWSADNRIQAIVILILAVLRRRILAHASRARILYLTIESDLKSCSIFKL